MLTKAYECKSGSLHLDVILFCFIFISIQAPQLYIFSLQTIWDDEGVKTLVVNVYVILNAYTSVC